MKKLLTLLTITMLMLSTSVFSQTSKTWTGAVSTAWSNAGNWSPSGVPNATHNVFIPSAPANQPYIAGTSTSVCNNLTVYSGAQIWIASTTTNSGMLTVNGTATFSGGLTLQGYLSLTGKIVANNVVWSSGSSITTYLGARMEVSGNWTFASGSAINMNLCSVTFTGSGNSYIYSYSAGSNFQTLTINKTGSGFVRVDSGSTSTMNINGTFNIQSGFFAGFASINYVLKGNLLNTGSFSFLGTTRLERASGTQQVQVTTGSSFNNLTIAAGASAEISINNDLRINGNLTIQSGTLNPNEKTLTVYGNWINTAGPANFIEGTNTGRVKFTSDIAKDGKTTHNFCNYTEDFNILEVENFSGGYFTVNNASAVVTCNKYDYTTGGIMVQAGTFTANDLVQNGITGYWGLQSGGIINLTKVNGYVDLIGATLSITGGTFNVYGGTTDSYWPYSSASSITMSGGVLNFAETGIRVQSSPALTHNITGGTIKTTGNFICYRSDFTLTGGEVEMYGNANRNLEMSAGSLHALKINKSSANSVSLAANAVVNGLLTVNSGSLLLNSKMLTTGGNIAVFGTMWLNESSVLMLGSDQNLTTWASGNLKVLGTSGNRTTISRSGATGNYFINIYGQISAKHANFHYVNPLRILSGGTIDPDNAFELCQFRYCTTGMLLVENTQTVQLPGVDFLMPASGYNVSKTVNSGRLTFREATGNFSGEGFENDPYNRVDWVIPQPGLWTGAVSTDWHTAENWDDGVVPDASTDVTIPGNRENMPFVSADAQCKNLTLEGTLTISFIILEVHENAEISGNLILNDSSTIFEVLGDLIWNEGSTFTSNSFGASIFPNGNFTFNAGSNVQLMNCGVRFRGTQNKNIINHSATSSFFNLFVDKFDGAAVIFSDASTQPLRINGTLSTNTEAKFQSFSSQNIELKQNIVSFGTIEIESSRIILNGAIQYIQPNVNDYFYHIDFNQSGTVTINTSNSDVLQVRGAISILSGVFNAGSSTIKLREGWNNEVGAAAFVAETSKVIFEGTGTQEIYYDENFNIVEINKNSGLILINSRVVTCNVFDWTKGQVRVANGGVFTAYDLADDGIVADFSLQSGSTVNLHQDIYQRVDLGGNLSITGESTVNVYGGNGWSQWPIGTDASLYMADGMLDFKDQGINVNSMSPNTLTLDITGGTIRTSEGFFCNRADFTPAAGIVELYGSSNAELTMEAGNLQGLTINKAVGSTVSLNSSGTTTILGITTVESGTFKILPGKELISDHIYVLPDGTFWLTENSLLKVTPGRELSIDGGMLIVHGTPSNNAVITRWFEMGEINMIVDNGGTISASNAYFSGMFAGVKITATGWVDPDHAFTNCTFEDSFSDGLLVIDNNQDLIIYDAHFPTASAPFNVQKTINNGSITFINATGDFAGEAFEDDPHNRIHWVTPQAGLWTGAASTDWHTPGNWDDGIVPDAATDVTIPENRSNMPVISATANCNNLFLHGTLSITGANILNINGSAEIYGQFVSNGSNSQITITGDIEWHTGSSANTTMNIAIYGNWSFLESSQASFPFGLVRFLGGDDAGILSNSHLSGFNNVWINKSAGKKVSVLAESNGTLIFNGILEIFNGNTYFSLANITTRLKGNLLNTGMFIFNGSAIFEKPSGTQQLQVTDGSSFNDLFISAGTGVNVSLSNHLTIYGNVVIQSGIFNPNEKTLTVYGDWINTAGPANFIEGTTTGKVIFTKEINKENKSANNFCNHTEHFNILEVGSYSGGYFTVDNPAAVVSCNAYNRVAAGGVSVLAGSFTANNLLQDGIFGSWTLQDGGTINLTQQGSNIDLNGTIVMSGGEFNVYGGNGASYWPGTTNATITMSGGTLNIADNGILVATGTANLSSSISGGTIKTTGAFSCYRDDFNPGGGTLELYGAADAFIYMVEGSLYDVNINKASAESLVNLSSDLKLEGLIVNNGIFKVTPDKQLDCFRTDVLEGGTLWLEEGVEMIINPTSELSVNGGFFKLMGEADNPISITTIAGMNEFNLAVLNDGTIAARNAHFSYVLLGVFVTSDGFVDPDHAFENCTFENGFDALLRIDNGQDIVIHNAHFPTASAPFNVQKTIDNGSITFINATGDFAGEAFEDDPHNRIHWINPQPGLWTGAVSTDWHTAGNWDDGVVPNATVDVTIPASAPNMPVLSANGYCKNMVLNGIINVGANCGLFINGNLDIYGRMNNTGFNSQVTVSGNVICHEGMYSQMPGNFFVHGNWTFGTNSETIMQTGTVTFVGNANSNLFVYSPSGYFNNLKVDKNPGLKLILNELSNANLGIHGNLEIQSGCTFQADSGIGLSLKGNIISSGNFNFNQGSILLASEAANQTIQVNPGDYFSSIFMNTLGTVSISNHLTINYDLEIQNGSFSANDYNINIKGSWRNYAGPGAFLPGSGKVIFDGGNYDQFVVNETFNILELNKSEPGSAALFVYGNVSCTKYDWTAGRIRIMEDATFTAQQLLDDAIMGGFIVPTTGTVNLSNPGGLVDLNNATITISGGTFNVYGGNDYSFWSHTNPSTLTMSAGTFNFEGPGIYINNYTDFTSNITGGTIKTTGQFRNERTDFNPTGGALEFYGAGNSQLRMEAGTLYDLTINKNSSADLYTNATINGSLEVNSGIFNVFGTTLTLNQHSEVIQAGSMMKLHPGSTVRIASGKVLNVGDGATLQSLGTAGNEVLFRNDGTGYYQIIANEGATISAEHTRFHYVNPLTIMPGSTIDPEYPLSNCQFRYATTGSLAINNNQDLMVRNVEFLKPNTGYNASKTVNSGSVNFRDAVGDHAGHLFEQDPNGRIDWVTTQPGLWTGLVSTDWHTPGNWDDGIVPDAATDVTILENRTNMPVISGTANCNNLFLHGTLSVTGSNILNINGSAEIYGQFASNGSSSQINITDNIEWHAGSSANTSMNIDIYGNWSFFEDSQANFPFGLVRFLGGEDAFILSNSHLSGFNNVWINKSAGKKVTVLAVSNNTLIFNGNLEIFGGNTYFSLANITTRLKGNLLNTGMFIFNGSASMEKTSGTQQIQATAGSSFNDILIAAASGVQVTLDDHLTIYGDVSIQSGIFNPNEHTLTVYGDWINTAGPDHFIEGTTTGKVVFTKEIYKENKSAHNFCNHSEHFNILEISSYSGGYFTVDNPAAVVSCNAYNRVAAGGVSVLAGTFTASDLLQDGIFGSWFLQDGGTINLTQQGTNIDLNGTIVMSGGAFNVFGGTGASYWPGTTNATITMSGGTLNIANNGILVAAGAASLASSISGGTIKTTGAFSCYREDFNPSGGTLELYGAADAFIYMVEGSLYDVNINKASTESLVNLSSDLTAQGRLEVKNGVFKSTPNVNLVIKHVLVYGKGTLWLTEGTDIKVKTAHGLVSSGGTLKFLGEPANNVTVGMQGEIGHANLTIDDGGSVAAINTHFSYFMHGVEVKPNGLVNTDYAFTNCTFEHGAFCLLSINNDQDVVIHNAQFPTNSASVNVRKTVDKGSITFVNAEGAFAGEEYEADLYDRIHWVSEPPVPLTLDLNNETISDDESDCFDAQHTITVSDFVVMDGGSATLIAGQNIILLPGTHIQQGGYMHAFITTTGEFCSLQKSMLAVADDEFIITEDEAPLSDMHPPSGKDEVLFRVYPNPTTGMFTLELAGAVDGRNSSMEIYTLMGERVMNEQLFGDAQHQFDLTFRPKGIYIVRVTIGDKMGIKKLVKH